jgi:hypothetical protein
MELTINDEKIKQLLKEIVVEMLQSKQDILHEIVVDALEEVGLAYVIAEGRNNNFVSEDAIFSILA